MFEGLVTVFMSVTGKGSGIGVLGGKFKRPGCG